MILFIIYEVMIPHTLTYSYSYWGTSYSYISMRFRRIHKIENYYFKYFDTWIFLKVKFIFNKLHLNLKTNFSSEIYLISLKKSDYKKMIILLGKRHNFIKIWFLVLSLWKLALYSNFLNIYNCFDKYNNLDETFSY